MKNNHNPQPVSDKPGLNKPVLPRISSQQLFANTNELIILHNGDDYRLRITSNGKLILTK